MIILIRKTRNLARANFWKVRNRLGSGRIGRVVKRIKSFLSKEEIVFVIHAHERTLSTRTKETIGRLLTEYRKKGLRVAFVNLNENGVKIKDGGNFPLGVGPEGKVEVGFAVFRPERVDREIAIRQSYIPSLEIPEETKKEAMAFIGKKSWRVKLILVGVEENKCVREWRDMLKDAGYKDVFVNQLGTDIVTDIYRGDKLGTEPLKEVRMHMLKEKTVSPETLSEKVFSRTVKDLREEKFKTEERMRKRRTSMREKLRFWPKE